MENSHKALLYNDYVQSANTLFHFVKESAFIKDALVRRALVPRYCKEDIGYLNIQIGENTFSEIAVLQKCFCDIPFHRLMEPFRLKIIDEGNASLTDEDRRIFEEKNTHPDFYGEYAIAFSKCWGEIHGLHPVQYVNERSSYTKDFAKLVLELLNVEDLPDIFADDIISRLVNITPLRGSMLRSFRNLGSQYRNVKMLKNFHDEREWRYVPSTEILNLAHLRAIIADQDILEQVSILHTINENLMSERYRDLWLHFEYDDIRYILVPDSQARIDIINTIMGRLAVKEE